MEPFPCSLCRAPLNNKMWCFCESGECEAPHCEDCTTKCSECGDIMCEAYIAFRCPDQDCNVVLCTACDYTSICSACNNMTCPHCLIKLDCCSTEEFCPACADDPEEGLRTCDDCGATTCSGCCTTTPCCERTLCDNSCFTMKKCDHCGFKECGDCMTRCSSCADNVCAECMGDNMFNCPECEP